MALTPEDVVNKRFNPTKFREGYDQDEVDDFLDEVVVELRRLNQENEELRQRLVAADGRISELQRSASQAPVAPAPAAPAPVAAAPAPVVAPAPVSAPPAPVPAPQAAPEFPAGQDGSMDQSNTNNLLQLARRLHEEHVREGMEKRDQLIAEGHATAARLVSDAETQQRTAIETLEQEKAGLEHRVEELRVFEAEYREKLKGYIEGQLRELESAAPIAAAEAPAQQAITSATPVYGEQPAPAPAYGAPVEAAPAPDFGTVEPAPVAEFPAPEYQAPEYQVPEYQAPEYQAAEFPTPEYQAPFGGDLSQAPAPQPASASTPPAYAGFPAPQLGSDAPQPEQSSEQPDYPAYSQRLNEYPGLGGN
ncbi:DivIVA domain-containing protein [Protaetiibacter intestinalis]|uniref:Cell wall synthesis protein Wag31 n=1 Tax=Protaetiibacter intestinalis TaxID=2419774 RepID=A0A387BL16_9MICO|nr:DivIVA domain-containing protein [Protaetiibacter intestinalis]AYF99200.1 DivIVA domain-containing protein [Protaetiibacter intestinalis]